MNEQNTQTPEMTALLEKLEKSAAIQQKCARRQSLMMTLAALACVGILVVLVLLFVQVQPLMQDLGAASEALSAVTEQLAGVDFNSTLEGLSQSAAKLEQLDIESLNSAIGGLAQMVESLSRFKLF